jgi:hypothetical protein
MEYMLTKLAQTATQKRHADLSALPLNAKPMEDAAEAGELARELAKLQLQGTHVQVPVDLVHRAAASVVRHQDRAEGRFAAGSKRVAGCPTPHFETQTLQRMAA